MKDSPSDAVAPKSTKAERLGDGLLLAMLATVLMHVRPTTCGEPVLPLLVSAFLAIIIGVAGTLFGSSWTYPRLRAGFVILCMLVNVLLVH